MKNIFPNTYDNILINSAFFEIEFNPSNYVFYIFVKYLGNHETSTNNC